MTEARNSSSSDVPKEPQIDTVEFEGSKAQIFDALSMFNRAQSEGILVYDGSDFNLPVTRASLSLEPVSTIDGDTAVGITGVIKIHNSMDEEQLKKNFIERYKPLFDHEYSELTVQGTCFDNTLIVDDSENGVSMMVAVYMDKIKINNQRKAFGVVNPSRTVEVNAPAVQTVDATSQLIGASKILIHTLGIANSVNGLNDDSSLKRTFSIGENILSLEDDSSDSKSLGQLVTKDIVLKTNTELESIEQVEEIVAEEDKLSLDDVGGLHEVKAKLRDIAISFSHPEIMEKWGADRPLGVILYGEPGTGKTMLVQALANELSAELWPIQGSDIYNMWLGNSEAQIKKIFSNARKQTNPTVVQFDEFDSIIGTNQNAGSGGSGAARNGVAGIFKQEMNTLAKDNPNILVVATTNHLDKIDSSLLRSGRFDHRIYVPLPDDEARTEIISNIISKAINAQAGTGFEPYTDSIDIFKITDDTDEMSGADICEIFRRINLNKAMQEAKSGSADPIDQNDIDNAVRGFKTQG